MNVQLWLFWTCMDLILQEIIEKYNKKEAMTSIKKSLRNDHLRQTKMQQKTMKELPFASSTENDDKVLFITP